MHFREFFENITAHNTIKKYYYRVHPRGQIHNILHSGLDSYSPAKMPGSFIDRPDVERWPDQEPEDPQTYRFYVADSIWSQSNDRINIRIPAEYIEDHLERDSLGDYYIDTGDNSEKIVKPNQFDILVGGRWVRADMVDPVMAKTWNRMYYQKPGSSRNFYNEPESEDEDN